MLLYLHHSKGLSLSNVLCLFLSIFIEGIPVHRNLRLKNTAFSEHFTLNMLFILKLLSSSLSGAPFPLNIYCLNDKTPPAYVANQKNFKGRCTLYQTLQIKMYIFKTNADRTYITSSKQNVHRNVEEIG